MNHVFNMISLYILSGMIHRKASTTAEM